MFRKIARNPNPPAPTRGIVGVAEVEAFAPLGSLERDTIHLCPACVGIESFTTVTKSAPSASKRPRFVGPQTNGRQWSAGPARRLVSEPLDVLSTVVPNHIPAGISVTLQSEDGILGMGLYPLAGEEQKDLTNEGKQTIAELPKPASSDFTQSFAEIQGGEIFDCGRSCGPQSCP